MGLFSRFESKAEDVIEGTGGSGRGGIEPVKLAKRAVKEMEREKMIGVGHEYAPTLYNVLLSIDDDARMSGYYPSLAGEIETYLTSRAEQNGLIFDCPPLVRFIVDEDLKRGKFDIIAESVSPAIIAELRHEEMVHYGIEKERPARVPEPQPARVPEPQPVPVAEPAWEAPQPEPVAEPQRSYPPTNAPLDDTANEEMIGHAAQTTILDEPVPEVPRAQLINRMTGENYDVIGERTTIGRETSCEVVIADPSVSRHHAEILHNESGWLVRDTGSTNGTSVNGTVTAQSHIYNGDIITLGKTQVEFRED